MKRNLIIQKKRKREQHVQNKKEEEITRRTELWGIERKQKRERELQSWRNRQGLRSHMKQIGGGEGQILP